MNRVAVASEEHSFALRKLLDCPAHRLSAIPCSGVALSVVASCPSATALAAGMTPSDIPRLAAAGFSAAAVVLCAAGYAILLALGRARQKPILGRAALGAYAGVVLAAVGLAWALRLDGLWLVLVAILLIGYFAAPRAIWRLSVATHPEETGDGRE